MAQTGQARRLQPCAPCQCGITVQYPGRARSPVLRSTKKYAVDWSSLPVIRPDGAAVADMAAKLTSLAAMAQLSSCMAAADARGSASRASGEGERRAGSAGQNDSHRIRAAARAQFAEHPPQVKPHRDVGDAQRLRDLLVAQSIHQQLRHLRLAVGETGGSQARLPQ